ncbi:MAG TPA: hypothetical protein VFH48_37480 [Chloroflexota bacterium]|nr:hypothetical protein [Chloroflexota bacterium]
MADEPLGTGTRGRGDLLGDSSDLDLQAVDPISTPTALRTPSP